MQPVMEAVPTQSPARLRRQGMWTYEDWLNFPDDGWKYEIINGELYMTPAPTPDHQRTSGGLFVRMYLHARDHSLGEVLEAPCAVRLPNQPVPVQPDIFFIERENSGIIGAVEVTGAPDLVVEILSPSNASYDREKKFNLYQEAGVPEYWLVNYWEKTVEVFRLEEGRYRLGNPYRIGDVVDSEQLAGFQIAVQTIFDFS